MGVNIGLGVRCVVLIVFIYTWNAHLNIQFPERLNSRLRYGSFYRFLTVLNFLLSILVNLFLVIGELLPKVRYVGHVLNYSVSFPVNAIVFVYFWTVYWIDRELIYPQLLQEYYPPWVSNIEHGLILPVALFNIVYQPFHMSRLLSYSMAGVSTLAYVAWIVHIYNVTGKWIYPFMNAMGTEQVLYIFFPLSLIVAVVFQNIGWRLNEMVHPSKHYVENNKKQN